MTASRIGVFFPALAGVATAGAIVAGSYTVVAVVLGGVAIFAAAMACARALGLDATPVPESPLEPSEVYLGVRDLFAAGREGREELVLRMDALEWSGPAPRAPGEMARILLAPPDLFLRYLAARVARVEGSR
jgi:hypothetical protein